MLTNTDPHTSALLCVCDSGWSEEFVVVGLGNHGGLFQPVIP